MPLACILASIGIVFLVGLAVFFYSRYKTVTNDYNDLVEEFNDQVDELDENERLRKEQSDTITRLQNDNVQLKTDRERADQYAQNLLRRLNDCHTHVEQLKQFQRDLPVPNTEMGQVLREVSQEKRQNVGMPPLAPRSRLVPESKHVSGYCSPVQLPVEPEVDLPPAPMPSPEATTVDQVASMLNSSNQEEIVQAELSSPTHVQSCTPVQTSGAQVQPTPNDWA